MTIRNLFMFAASSLRNSHCCSSERIQNRTLDLSGDLSSHSSLWKNVLVVKLAARRSAHIPDRNAVFNICLCWSPIPFREFLSKHRSGNVLPLRVFSSLLMQSIAIHIHSFRYPEYLRNVPSTAYAILR